MTHVDAATGNRIQPARRQRLPASERRTVISRAAVEVFAERGFEAASLDEIARRAGVTKPLLYRHFASKTELYIRLLEDETDDLLRGVAAAVAAETDPLARLRAGIDAFFDHVERRPLARRLLFRDPDARPELAAAHERVQSEMTAALAGLLDSNPRLLASDPERELTIELFAHVLKTALNGIAAWWLEHPGTERRTVVERTMQLLAPGLDALQEAPPAPRGRREAAG